MSTINVKNPILIDFPLPIETSRMLIRDICPGDGAMLNEAKLETWDDLNRWMIWAKEKQTIDEDEIVAREAHAKFIKREDAMMVALDKETGRYLGGTGLHRFNWQTRTYEIGYWYRKSVHGMGYATEGTKALIRYAFDVLDARKIVIYHADGNDASRRVIEKCGFEFEYTVVKDDLLPNGQIVDWHAYSLFNADHLKDFDVTWGA